MRILTHHDTAPKADAAVILGRRGQAASGSGCPLVADQFLRGGAAAARDAHNVEVEGSSPSCATKSERDVHLPGVRAAEHPASPARKRLEKGTVDRECDGAVRTALARPGHKSEMPRVGRSPAFGEARKSRDDRNRADVALVTAGETASESRAKATKGKAGNADGTPVVRQTTTGTGLRVGAADAVQSATSEFMDVTAGETALILRLGASERWSRPTSSQPRRMAPTGGDRAEKRSTVFQFSLASQPLIAAAGRNVPIGSGFGGARQVCREVRSC